MSPQLKINVLNDKAFTGHKPSTVLNELAFTWHKPSTVYEYAMDSNLCISTYNSATSTTM